MKTVKVLSYNAPYRAHRLLDLESGKETFVDVTVNGDLPGVSPEELVGKTLEYAYDYPCMSIAMHVKVKEEV